MHGYFPVQLTVDHVVVAVGLEPNTELADSSGLPVDSVNGGFITDSQMKICDDIYAVSTLLFVHLQLVLNVIWQP